MKRDMDLLRKILLKIESGKNFFDIRSTEMSRALGIDEEGSMERAEADKWEYHLNYLQEEGFAKFVRTGGGGWRVERLTMSGHDFIDSVRDEKVWKQTKEGAAKVGGFTLKILSAIAKELIKEKLKKHTGLEINL